mmetsp:Transcript_30852/g.67494  ORF Transcript_30852/g.67494 Transcript_30852/m.67494 type:complete len:259 (-) Transcript_30852:700-1476(-)
MHPQDLDGHADVCPGSVPGLLRITHETSCSEEGEATLTCLHEVVCGLNLGGHETARVAKVFHHALESRQGAGVLARSAHDAQNWLASMRSLRHFECRGHFHEGSSPQGVSEHRHERLSLGLTDITARTASEEVEHVTHQLRKRSTSLVVQLTDDSPDDHGEFMCVRTHAPRNLGRVDPRFQAHVAGRDGGCAQKDTGRAKRVLHVQALQNHEGQAAGSAAGHQAALKTGALGRCNAPATTAHSLSEPGRVPGRVVPLA